MDKSPWMALRDDATMDDSRVGAAFRAVRVRRRLRQVDVARKAGVSQQMVSLIERGHLDQISLESLRRIAAGLDVRIDVYARWRGGDLDRLLNRHHSALHELVARWFAGLPAWLIAPEVSFAIYADRGVIDILAWHAATRSLLVIELKTEIVDVQETLGMLDRKRRVAASVARDRSWFPLTVSSWLIVAPSRTTRRRLQAHASTLRAAFPAERRTMERWLRQPTGAINAMSVWPDTNRGGTRLETTSRKRVSGPARRGSTHGTTARKQGPAGSGPRMARDPA